MYSTRNSRRRLHVATLVGGSGAQGGGERLAREIAMRLDAGRFESTFCVSRWPPPPHVASAAEAAVAAARDAGVRFIGLERRSAWQLGAWRPLLSVLRHGHVDVLHAHMFGSNVWAAVLGPLARVPVVIAHEHTWSFEGQWIRRFLDRNLIGRRVDAFLAVSREDRRRMIEIERIDPEKLIFVPNGIPTPPRPSGRDVRAELGLIPSVPLIGTVCTLRPQKAIDVLIRATAVLSKQLPGLRLLVVGDGPLRPQIERLIAELGLEDTVILLGYRPDVPDVLQALDVAVCSSDFEGTPLSVMEYMEAGLPVVATRVGGVPDLIEAGVHGLLVAPQDPEGLASAVAELLADPARAKEMGARARRRRRAEFDIDRTVRRLEQIYVGLARGQTAAQV